MCWVEMSKKNTGADVLLHFITKELQPACPVLETSQ